MRSLSDSMLLYTVHSLFAFCVIFSMPCSLCLHADSNRGHTEICSFDLVRDGFERKPCYNHRLSPSLPLQVYCRQYHQLPPRHDSPPSMIKAVASTRHFHYIFRCFLLAPHQHSALLSITFFSEVTQTLHFHFDTCHSQNNKQFKLNLYLMP